MCLDAVRVTPQVWSTSPARMSGWLVMFVCQVDVWSVRNLICVPFKTLRWLSIGLVLWCGVPSRWLIRPLVVPVKFHVLQNLLIRGCDVPGHSAINRCWHVLVRERVLGGRLWRSAWNSFPEGNRLCKRGCCKHCFSVCDSLCLFFVSNVCAFLRWNPGSWRSGLARQRSLR